MFVMRSLVYKIIMGIRSLCLGWIVRLQAGWGWVDSITLGSGYDDKIEGGNDREMGHGGMNGGLGKRWDSF